MTATEDVLASHLAAFRSGDVERVLADYAVDAVIVSQLGTFRGQEEIAGLFEQLLAEFSAPEAGVTVDDQVVEGEYGYVVWHGQTPVHDYEFATDTVVVRDGAIVAQTFAAKTMSKA